MSHCYCRSLFSVGFTQQFPLPSSKKLQCVTAFGFERTLRESPLSMAAEFYSSLLTTGAIILVVQITFLAHIAYVSFFQLLCLFCRKNKQTNTTPTPQQENVFFFWVKQNWILLRQRNTGIVSAQRVPYTHRCYCSRTRSVSSKKDSDPQEVGHCNNQGELKYSETTE